IAGIVLCLGLLRSVSAQEPGREREDVNEPVTMFPHPDDSRLWLSGQMNVVAQAHPSFRSPYESDHSLRSGSEHATSTVETLFVGVTLTPKLEALMDVESAGGRGISDAFGLAGFTDLDVVRNPSLGSAPYIARVMLHYTVPLSGEQMPSVRGPLSL